MSPPWTARILRVSRIEDPGSAFSQDVTSTLNRDLRSCYLGVFGRYASTWGNSTKVLGFENSAMRALKQTWHTENAAVICPRGLCGVSCAVGGISGMVVKWGVMIFSGWFLVSGCQGHLKFPSAFGKSLRNNYLLLGCTKILYSIVLPCPTHSETSSLKPKH